MITVRAIRYTSDPAEWAGIATALGLRQAEQRGDSWRAFQGEGLFAVHVVPTGDALDGVTELQVVVPDLADARRAVEASGWRTDGLELDDGSPYFRIAGDEGVLVGAVEASIATTPPVEQPASSPTLAVMPIWYAPELGPRRAALEALGLRARTAADSGTWLDFQAAGGGLCALHQDARVRIELSFETQAPERTHADLVDADLIDEAYNRTVIARTRGGAELWINGPIDDLHGYHRVELAAGQPT